MTEEQCTEILCFVAQEIISPLACEERTGKELFVEWSGERFNELCKKVYEIQNLTK